MMGPLEAVGSVFSKFAMFRGRAPRSEYWWFFLFEMLAMPALIALDLWFLSATPEVFYDPLQIDPLSLFTLYYMVLSFIPRLAVMCRRLHDAGLSGFFILTQFIPIVGWLVLMVLLSLPSEDDDNIHGAAFRRVNVRTRHRANGGIERHDPMQGYAHLIANAQEIPPEVQAARKEARKAEVRKLYEERVLGVKPAQ